MWGICDRRASPHQSNYSDTTVVLQQHSPFTDVRPMKRPPVFTQILAGAAAGLVIALIHALGASDPDPIFSTHGLTRLFAGAVGGALVSLALYRVSAAK